MAVLASASHVAIAVAGITGTSYHDQIIYIRARDQIWVSMLATSTLPTDPYSQPLLCVFLKFKSSLLITQDVFWCPHSSIQIYSVSFIKPLSSWESSVFHLIFRGINFCGEGQNSYSGIEFNRILLWELFEIISPLRVCIFYKPLRVLSSWSTHLLVFCCIQKRRGNQARVWFSFLSPFPLPPSASPLPPSASPFSPSSKNHKLYYANLGWQCSRDNSSNQITKTPNRVLVTEWRLSWKLNFARTDHTNVSSFLLANWLLFSSLFVFCTTATHLTLKIICRVPYTFSHFTWGWMLSLLFFVPGNPSICNKYLLNTNTVPSASQFQKHKFMKDEAIGSSWSGFVL